MFFSLILEIKIIVGAPKFVRFIPKYFNKCGKEFFDTKLEYQDLEIGTRIGNVVKLKHPYEMIAELKLSKIPEDGLGLATLMIKTKQKRIFYYEVKIQPSDVNSGVYDLDRIRYMGGLDENGKVLIKDVIEFYPERAIELGKEIIDQDSKDSLCLEIYNQTDSEIEINHREDMIAEFIFLKHPKSKFWHLQIIKKEKHQWYNVDIEVDLEHPNWHIVRKIIPIDNIKLKSNSENIQKNEMNVPSSNVTNNEMTFKENQKENKEEINNKYKEKIFDENDKMKIPGWIEFSPDTAKKYGKILVRKFMNRERFEIDTKTDSEITLKLKHQDDNIAEFRFNKNTCDQFWKLKIKTKKGKCYTFLVKIHPYEGYAVVYDRGHIQPIDNIKLKSNSKNIQKNEMNISSSNVINDKNKEIKFDEIEQMTNQQESKFIKSDSQYNVGRNDDEIMSINNESDQENLFGVKQENYEDDKGNITAIFPDE